MVGSCIITYLLASFCAQTSRIRYKYSCILPDTTPVHLGLWECSKLRNCLIRQSSTRNSTPFFSPSALIAFLLPSHPWGWVPWQMCCLSSLVLWHQIQQCQVLQLQSSWSCTSFLFNPLIAVCQIAWCTFILSFFITAVFIIWIHHFALQTNSLFLNYFLILTLSNI